ncbi:MAG: prolipoprotein diacylglyceryl transferase [Clostridiaceae bacterium]|nr:prolipoprotein diacylglyceryl transferase [Clostridiaceae bacterium]
MMGSILLDVENVDFPGLGIEGIKVDNVAFAIGNVQIYWYGILIALAMFLCVFLAILHSKKNRFSADLVIDIALVSFPAAMVGARLYYVFSEWDYYKGDLMRIINIRDGGLGVIGGVLAAFLAGYILIRVKKLPVHVVFDYCIVYIPLGQAIGRWGNFFNQEAFGTNTNLPWGMISEQTSRYLDVFCPELDPNVPVHPTFLYESLATLLIFFALVLIRKKSKYAFDTTSGYLVLYGLIRFFIEALRTDSLYIGDTGIRLSQFTSALMVIVGIALVITSRKRNWERVTVSMDDLYTRSNAQKRTEASDNTPLAATQDKDVLSEDSTETTDDANKSVEEPTETTDDVTDLTEDFAKPMGVEETDSSGDMP